MKTLIATDGSQEATVAVRGASRLLRKDDNETSILCVAPEFLGAVSGRRIGRQAPGSSFGLPATNHPRIRFNSKWRGKSSLQKESTQPPSRNLVRLRRPYCNSAKIMT